MCRAETTLPFLGFSLSPSLHPYILFSSSEFEASSSERYSFTVDQPESLLSAILITFILLETTSVPASKAALIDLVTGFCFQSIGCFVKFVQHLNGMVQLLLVSLSLTGVTFSTCLFNCFLDSGTILLRKPLGETAQMIFENLCKVIG